MPNIILTDEQLQGLIVTLECARDDAADNGAEDHAIEIEGLIRTIGTTSDLWSDDLVQFARLLDEVHAVIEPKLLDKLAEHMDLPRTRVQELFDRAARVFEAHKPRPPDFEAEMRLLLFDRGLEASEILEHLDPDTAGEDLIELVRKLMEER